MVFLQPASREPFRSCRARRTSPRSYSAPTVRLHDKSVVDFEPGSDARNIRQRRVPRPDSVAWAEPQRGQRLPGRLDADVMNGVEPETRCGLDELESIFDIGDLLGRKLSEIEGQAIDGCLGLTEPDE